MSEQIVIEGNGKLSSYTDIPNAKDKIESKGNYQNYERGFDINGESSSLRSKYELINTLNESSSYFIEMDGKNEHLQHIVGITGNSDIFSNCTVTRSALDIASEDSIDLSTNFSISGQGELKEFVIDRNINSRPDYIVNTVAEGENVFLTSILAESTLGPSKLPKIKGFESIGNKTKVEEEGATITGQGDDEVILAPSANQANWNP
jgi:hypothetical protein